MASGIAERLKVATTALHRIYLPGAWISGVPEPVFGRTVNLLVVQGQSTPEPPPILQRWR